MKTLMQMVINIGVVVLVACGPGHSNPGNPGTQPSPLKCVKKDTQIMLVTEASQRMTTSANGEVEVIRGFWRCIPHAKWYKTGPQPWQGFWGCERPVESKWELLKRAVSDSVSKFAKDAQIGLVVYPVEQTKPCHGWFCSWFKPFKWVPCAPRCRHVRDEFGFPSIECDDDILFGNYVPGRGCRRTITKECAVAEGVDLEPGATASQITARLEAITPGGKSPTSDALELVKTYFGSQNAQGKSRHVILITDGDDTCNDNAPSMVQQLHALGIDVWVVAFQTSTSPDVLSLMADYGGHALQGDVKYRVLKEPGDLAQVLEEILNAESPEVCDGVDNDCDGKTDEDLVRECASACGAGLQFCQNGQWGPCLDDDTIAVANGQNASGGSEVCKDGKIAICHIPPGNPGNKHTLCIAPPAKPAHMSHGDTEGPCPPRQSDDMVIPDIPQELCDGIDNDCDGQTDENFDVGAPCTVSNGSCTAVGKFVCAPDQLSVVCDAVAPTPEPEVCDGLDNDCDGQIDEDLTKPCSSSCGEGISVCRYGVWSDCQITKPAIEKCDGIDNDCDGLVDEGFHVGEPCTIGTGKCQASGVLRCTEDGLSTYCDTHGQGGGGGVEVCNGIDDDCDGLVDNGKNICPAGQVCYQGRCVYD